jgi:hypothetical protein
MTAPSLMLTLRDRVADGEALPFNFGELDPATRQKVTEWAVARALTSSRVWPSLRRDANRHAATVTRSRGAS